MIVDQLNNAARKYYLTNSPKPDHQKYLEECFDHLNGHLKKALAGKYLFSALTSTSKSDRKVVSVASSNTSETGYDFDENIQQILEPRIKLLLADVNLERCISLTSTLLDDPQNGRDLILQSRDDYVAIQDQRPKTQIFTTRPIVFSENFEDFMSSHENGQEIKRFRGLIKAFGEFDNETIGRLIWHYKKLETLCAYAKQAFFVHFIRPSFIEFDNNILLSLATNEVIDPQSLLVIDLLVYRIASQMAIEKTKEADKIENLKLVSNSIHSIKTGTNILLSPALNSLAEEFDGHYLVRKALEARDQLLTVTEIINLISKLFSKHLTNPQKKNELLNSKLYTTENEQFHLSTKLQEIVDLNSRDMTKPVVILDGDKHVILDQGFLSFEGVNPSESFYLFLLITVIENCLKHGLQNFRTSEITLTIRFDVESKFLEFSNRSNSDEHFEITYEDSTGYINYLFFIFDELKLGTIKCKSKKGIFSFTIRSK